MSTVNGFPNPFLPPPVVDALANVNQVTGTTNQINVSPNTGNVVVSLPTTVTTGGYVANSTISSSLAASAAYSYGTLSFSDTNMFESFQTSVNNYAQTIIQNTSAGATASCDYVVANNLGTATTYYADFGMNSSGFTGAGSFNQPNMAYFTSTSGDLAIGTTTNNSLHFVLNSATTDNMTLSSTGLQLNTPLFFGSSAIAAAGTSQGTATAVTTDNTYVTSGTGGVILPVATVGREISITNRTGAAINIYPQASSSIESLGANTPVSLPANVTVTLAAETSTLWWTVAPIVVAGTNITITTSGSGTASIAVSGTVPTATTATNVTGGAAGSLVYQTGAATTTTLALGTTGYVLTAGASAPTWTNPSSITVGTATNATNATTATTATTATNVTGGAAGSLIYNTAAATTTTLGIGTNGQVLQTNAGATAPQWTTALSPNLTVANVAANTNSTAISNTAYTDQYLTTGAVNFIADDFNMVATSTVSASNLTYGDTSWGIAPITGGTTGTYAPAISTQQNPGQAIMTTPAVSGQGISLYKGGGGGALAPLGVLGAETGWQLDFWVILPATITNYAFRVGACVSGQQAADAPTGGFWVEYDTANASSSTTMELRTVNASTSTYVNTTVTPTASYVYHFRFTSTVAGTIKAQVGANNGALGTAVTSNTNVDTTHLYMPFIQVLPRTTTAVTLNVDRYSHSIPLTRV